MSIKVATIQACAVEVICPHCGETQPSPDNGSDMWLPSQVTKAENEPPRTCVSCDERFKIIAQNKVLVGVG